MSCSVCGARISSMNASATPETGFYGSTCSSDCARTAKLTESIEGLGRALNDVAAWLVDALRR